MKPGRPLKQGKPAWWLQKYRYYHPHTCPACHAATEQPGACSPCAERRARTAARRRRRAVA